MAIFSHRIMVYNTDDENFPAVSAKYFGGSIKLTSVYQSKIKPDPEDLVVVNIPWDIIQMAYIDVPNVKKYKDVLRLAGLEIRRLMDINEEVNVGVLKSIAGKMLALFIRRSDYMRYKEVNNFDFEPDVAYPNILSELLLIKKLPGIWAYIVLGTKNSGIVLMENDSFINLRV
ncbi:MAG: hypothetical protein ACK4R7_05820, partial [Fervidobacterium sp.]